MTSVDSSNAEPGPSAIARLAAATALPKPAAAHAAPIDLRLCARRLESASSSHARTSSGKSGRIDDSLQDPGLAASTGMASSGSRSVDWLRPYTRGHRATISPVPGSVIRTPSRRMAARSVLPCSAAPARYRFESMSICPYLSALRLSHLIGSNVVEGSGISAARSSPNTSPMAVPLR